MTGTVNLETKFDLPSPYQGGEVVDRLKLDGKFGIGDMQFTNPGVRGKVENLSDRAQGRPNDHHEDDPLSQLRGDFRLRRAVITLRDLGFQVAGAKVELDGTYGLRSEVLDFHGKVQLQAKPSQMVTGFKSVLLRPFDHFLRKNGVTELPIKVTGKRDHPAFGLRFPSQEGPSESAAIRPGRDHPGTAKSSRLSRRAHLPRQTRARAAGADLRDAPMPHTGWATESR